MRALAIALVLATAGAASANPLARLSADLDGDGADEQLELTADGVVHIRGKTSADVKVAGEATQGTLGVSQWNGRPLVVVGVTAHDASESIVIAQDRKRWSELVRVPTGTTLDRDFGFAVDATPDGVIRYQTRPGVRRCDGKSPLLFPEVFDADAKKFRRVTPPVGIDANAPTLQAHADATPAVVPIVFQARAASTQGGAADAGGLTIPSELDDGKPETAWREDLGSDGRGQFFTFEPRVPGAHARQIRIVPRSGSTARDANRPHRLGVVAKGNAWWIELPDAMRDPPGTAYVVDLPGTVEGCVTIVLDTMYRGGPSNTTMIAELEVFADGERAGGGEALLAQAVAAGTDDQAASAALARRGAPAVTAIEAALAKTSDANARRRLVRALLPIRDASAVPVLAHAATAGWVMGNDLVAVIEALGARGATAELRELAARRDLDLRARIAAVTGLRGTTPAAVAALVELAGSGPRDLRRAVIDALAAAPVDVLVPAAQAATSPSIAGDIWRGLVGSARADAKQRPAAIAALAAALPTATDYERKYRIVEGLATLGDAPALRALADALKAMPAGAEATAMRQVAARAIATSPRPEATELVLALVGDSDAGVRLAALAALAGAKSDATGPWHTSTGPDGIDRVIVTALGADPWPEVRQRAAEALATRCERPGPAKALEASVTRDRAVGVAGASLASLVECRAPGVADLIARTWDDTKRPVALRARAVDLAVALDDRALSTKLVARLSAWRAAALSSAESLELARHAAPALGRLNPPGAATALLAALEDSAYPEIVAAAAAGLGFLGPACPAQAKTKLRVLAKSDEQQVSIAASRAAAQCGR